MERTSANLSMRFAIFGSSSEIRMPGTFVEIGLKLLLDLGSHVSMWLGPPSSQKRITALALPFGGRTGFGRGGKRLPQGKSEKAERSGGDKTSAAGWMLHRPSL